LNELFNALTLQRRRPPVGRDSLKAGKPGLQMPEYFKNLVRFQDKAVGILQDSVLIISACFPYSFAMASMSALTSATLRRENFTPL